MLKIAAYNDQRPPASAAQELHETGKKDKFITLGGVQTAAETHFSAWPASAATLTACSWLRHVLRHGKGSWQPVGYQGCSS